MGIRPGLFVGAIILGIGQAFAFPALMTIAVNSAPASERGSVMGTFTAFFDLSFGGGAIALGALRTPSVTTARSSRRWVWRPSGWPAGLRAAESRPVEVRGDRIVGIEPPGE